MTNEGLGGATAIVTGAARGIGLGIAERFFELGAEVIGWDVIASDNPLFKAFFTCDVTVEASVNEAARASLAETGPIDVRQAWRVAPMTGAGNREAKADREVT